MAKNIRGTLVRKGEVVGINPQWVAVRDNFTVPPSPDYIPVTMPPDPTFRVPRDGERGPIGPPGKGSTLPGPPGRDSNVPGPAGVDGKSLRHRGLFNSRTAYESNDLVSDGDGSTYICIQEHTGRRLQNTRFFQPFAMRGERGEPGKNETTVIRHGSPRLVSAMEEIAQLREQLEPQTAIAAVNLAKSQVIFINDSGEADIAAANLPNLPVGIVTADALAGQVVPYVVAGPIEFSEWALEPGKVYFLSEIPGTISTSSPTGDGLQSIVVGTALTENILKLDIERTVKL